jgi:hypothetical protein
MMAERRGEEISLYPFFNLASRRVWVVNATPRPLYVRETVPAPIVQDVG